MKSIQNQIKRLLKQKNAVLVAHYYVSGDLQDWHKKQVGWFLIV
ncbi:Quinolinate synthetase (EC [uncultured Gammaproteobacteria bacterium]|nr:Quinolinate synthetase (EC [uncultured Gammaproteobacteria bacterium]